MAEPREISDREALEPGAPILPYLCRAPARGPLGKGIRPVCYHEIKRLTACFGALASLAVYREEPPADRNRRHFLPRKTYRGTVKLKRTKDRANLPPKGEASADQKDGKPSSVNTLVDDAPRPGGDEDLGAPVDSKSEEIPDCPFDESENQTDGARKTPENVEASDQVGADEVPTEEAPGPPDEIAQLKAEIENLQSENGELMDRLQRAQAEFENTRKRLTREKSDAREYAALGTIESLLPIVDDFERALGTPGIDPQVQQGLEMIWKRVFEVFERAGLKQVNTEDEKFNPYLHHAVDKAAAESDEQDQTILEVFQKGYSFKDRLLRAALVKVAVKD